MKRGKFPVPKINQNINNIYYAKKEEFYENKML